MHDVPKFGDEWQSMYLRLPKTAGTYISQP
jgi:hypothetical protein